MTDASATFLSQLRQRARTIKQDTYAIYLACRDPRTPWYARVLAGGIVAYALSPIDLIPDFVPILGYLDDLIIVPFGIALAVRMIPEPVLADCRLKAQLATAKPANRKAAGGHHRDLACYGGASRLGGLQGDVLTTCVRNASP